MQNCQIADAYSHCQIVVWEEHVNKLTEDQSYQISNVSVYSYNGSKYLSASGFHVAFEQVAMMFMMKRTQTTDLYLKERQML